MKKVSFYRESFVRYFLLVLGLKDIERQISLLISFSKINNRSISVYSCYSFSVDFNAEIQTKTEA